MRNAEVGPSSNRKRLLLQCENKQSPDFVRFSLHFRRSNSPSAHVHGELLIFLNNNNDN